MITHGLFVLYLDLFVFISVLCTALSQANNSYRHRDEQALPHRYGPLAGRRCRIAAELYHAAVAGDDGGVGVGGIALTPNPSPTSTR